MKPVAKLDKNLTRVVKMESAKRQAVIQHHPPVSHVQSACGYGEPFAEVLSDGQIHRGMPGQVVQDRAARSYPRHCGTIAIAEARAVVDVARDESIPGKRALDPDVESIPLVMIQLAVIGGRGVV